MKDFGWIKIGGKNIHVTAEDDCDVQEIFSTLLGMKIGAELYQEEN